MANRSTTANMKDSPARPDPTDSDEPQDDSSSVCSTSTADVSSRGDPPTQRRRRKRGRKPQPQLHCKVEYRYSGHAREDHGQPLFGVQFNCHLRSAAVQAVATCGGPRVSVYELTDCLKLVQCYADPDPDEMFYTCAWSYEEATGRPARAASSASSAPPP